MSASGPNAKCRSGRRMSAVRGRFNRSAQHLLVLLDQGVAHGDITDMVHGSAEGGAVERWKSGSSAAAISRALDRRNKTGVLRIVTLHGGIAPAPHRRALAALRLEEREEISRGIAVGQSIRQIALGLGRAPSTVSREPGATAAANVTVPTRRTGGLQNPALDPKPCRLALHRELRWRVAQKLALQWSPEQISGWLKREFRPTRTCRYPTKRSIVVSLSFETRGVLKKELTAHLRTRRQMRLPKSHNAGSGPGHILDMVSIRQRPAEAEDGAVFHRFNRIRRE